MKMWLVAALATLYVLAPGAESHGYIAHPAGRSSAWRYGFDNPINWTDDELNCGGFSTQWTVNDGKCGPCGDPYNEPRPRKNEAGGYYGNGILTGNFTRGQTVEIEIMITVQHGGWFEFKVCPTNDPKKLVEQECLDQHVLQLADGSGTKFYAPSSGKGSFFIKVNLPSDLTCSYCVIQWWWKVANSWGQCPDGTGAIGCGPQETFVNCADISIH
ncbi:uncharacterized protein LOC143039859 [Oratosquilla oratoria]|uniref:uncharacterized protein LOC143039843 n=1 Tax=Oratosquilla oratoria TaxID=337810 RepID=UPI003F772317